MHGLAAIGAVVEQLVEVALLDRRPVLPVMPSARSCAHRVGAGPASTNSSKTRRTRAASVSLTTSLRSRIEYPSGTLPPIHIPRALEAANLSRMRSPITSRSNCAK